jgi:Fe-S cluster biogenesis protein NfuA/nitrite reductase/ring-hydroxylating ferredoxin subunit
LNDTDARERVARVETLLEEVEGLPDSAARKTALDLAQAMLELYGEGLSRFVDHVAEQDDGRLAEAVAGDELVAHLLLLHGLHPVPLEDRVLGALEEVRPYLESHGGDVQLAGVDEGVVRLRLEGSCSGCPSSTATLKLAIEDAIHKAAPDIEGIEAEGAAAPAAPPGLIQLEVLPTVPREPAPRPDNGWAMAGGMPDMVGNGPLLKRVSGEDVLFLRLDGRFYAYRPRCPACEGSIAGAALDGEALACPECGSRYDARRAGRGLEGGEAHLEPVPLLVDDAGLVKVSLGAA